MKDLRRVGVERRERESFQVSIICHATFLFSLSPLTEAGGGLRRVRLPYCRPPLALLSFISGCTLTHSATHFHNGCCIDFGISFFGVFFFFLLNSVTEGQKQVCQCPDSQNSVTYLLMPFGAINYHILLMYLNIK